MPLSRTDFGRDEYLMTVNVTGIRSIYDTSTREDLDISELHHGIMGNFTREGVVALYALRKEVEDKNGGKLRVTDMFRTWNMQAQAHQDYITGKKKALSPPPGESFHGAARSTDWDIALIDETLNPIGVGKKGFDLFWEIYNDLGFTGVLVNRYRPDRNATEAWHIDFMGSFKALYDRQGYKAAAIVANMDAIGNNFIGQEPEYIKNMRIQAYLLHLRLLQQDITGFWNDASQIALNDYLEGSGNHSEFNLVLNHYNIEKINTSSSLSSDSINFLQILVKIFKGLFRGKVIKWILNILKKRRIKHE